MSVTSSTSGVPDFTPIKVTDTPKDFELVAKSLGKESIGPNALKTDTNIVGVKLSEKNIVYYTKADYQQIDDSLDYFMAFKGELEDTYKALSDPNLSKEQHDKFSDNFDRLKNAAKILPKMLRPAVFDLINKVEPQFEIYELKQEYKKLSTQQEGVKGSGSGITKADKEKYSGFIQDLTQLQDEKKATLKQMEDYLAKVPFHHGGPQHIENLQANVDKIKHNISKMNEIAALYQKIIKLPTSDA